MNFIDSTNYRIPTIVGTEITSALLQFREGGKRSFIDTVDWPLNTGCNGRKNRSLSIEL
ncbi:MAG: hypothetical protein KBC84_09425 [Proteobacteria bacterium]|nr:hypothetical protein [Pseudomonadota bacterium]